MNLTLDAIERYQVPCCSMPINVNRKIMIIGQARNLGVVFCLFDVWRFPSVATFGSVAPRAKVTQLPRVADRRKNFVK